MRLPDERLLLVALSLVAYVGAKGADYYAVLGVPRNADQGAIKKAYRSKSLEYHPDKCEGDKDECQTKFIEVSTAYEVLSDAEKRKVYDQHGEEGLKEGHQSNEQAKAMFRQFFGREPDGNVRIIRRGGQMMFQEEGEPGPKEDIYGDTNVTEMNKDLYNSQINDRIEPWIVQFYKPNNDASREAKEEYVKFADTFKDFLNVASVNCRQQREVCSKASINEFPDNYNMDPSQQANVTQPLPPAYPGPPNYGTKQTGVVYPQQPGFQGQAGVTTIIHTQPTHIVMGMRFFEDPTAMTCPYCQASIVTGTTYVSGTLTWIACGGVALMGGWLGCCLIPFCIDALKDVIHSCPNCNRQVGVYRRV